MVVGGTVGFALEYYPALLIEHIDGAQELHRARSYLLKNICALAYRDRTHSASGGGSGQPQCPHQLGVVE